MRGVTFDASPARGGLLRRLRMPALALGTVAVAALLSPIVHAVLTLLIWASWSLIAVLAARAAGLRVPARARELGPVLGLLSGARHRLTAYLPGETARARSGARQTQTASTN